MHRDFSAATLLAATLLCAAGTSRAASVATSTLDDFRITLTDLAPSDGVAPLLELDPLSRSRAQAGAVAPGANTFWDSLGTSAFAPVSVSGQLYGSGGAASLSGDPFGAGATLTGSAVGRPGFLGGSGSVYVDTQPSGETSFKLSAHTQVTFAGMATIDWSAGDPRASATGDFGLSFMEAVAGGVVSVAQAAWSAGYSGAGDPQAGSASLPLSITFANDSDGWVVLDYSVNVFASASEVDVPPTPVDEPAGAALLLLGALPLMKALRRRRC